MRVGMVGIYIEKSSSFPSIEAFVDLVGEMLYKFSMQVWVVGGLVAWVVLLLLLKCH